MDGFFQSAVQSITYVLNLHYDVVTNLAQTFYNVSLTCIFVVKSIGYGFQQLYNGVAVLVQDGIHVLAVIGKLLTWLFAWSAIFVQNLLLAGESVLYNIYLGLSWCWTVIWWGVDEVVAAVGWLVRLPVTLLALVDNHMLWCYGEMSLALGHAVTVTVDAVASILYHMLLTPYYIGYCVSEGVKNATLLLVRVCRQTALITEDSFHRMRSFTATQTNKLVNTLTDAGDAYIMSAHHFNAELQFQLWKFSVLCADCSDQVYYSDSSLLFSQQASFTDLLRCIIHLPFKALNAVVREITCWTAQFFTPTSTMHSGSGSVIVKYSVFNVPQELYCCVEEALWITWLTVSGHWQELLIFSMTCVGMWLAVKRHRIVRGMPGNIRLAVEVEEVDPQLTDDEVEETFRLQLPRVRSQRDVRSRSHTPDLTTPGAETRYIHKLKRTLDEELSSRTCVVCQHYSRNILLLPCKHVCLCSGCAEEVLRRPPLTCPLCRKKIEQVIDVYL